MRLRTHLDDLCGEEPCAYCGGNGLAFELLPDLLGTHKPRFVAVRRSKRRAAECESCRGTGNTACYPHRHEQWANHSTEIPVGLAIETAFYETPWTSPPWEPPVSKDELEAGLDDTEREEAEAATLAAEEAARLTPHARRLRFILIAECLRRDVERRNSARRQPVPIPVRDVYDTNHLRRLERLKKALPAGMDPMTVRCEYVMPERFYRDAWRRCSAPWRAMTTDGRKFCRTHLRVVMRAECKSAMLTEAGVWDDAGAAP